MLICKAVDSFEGENAKMHAGLPILLGVIASRIERKSKRVDTKGYGIVYCVTSSYAWGATALPLDEKWIDATVVVVSSDVDQPSSLASICDHCFDNHLGLSSYGWYLSTDPALQ